MRRRCWRGVLLALALLMLSATLVLLWRATALRASPVTAEALELGAAFKRAREAIRQRQTPQGFWTTPYTPRAVFENPATEVNVFVPAVMVDLLQPVAGETGLADVMGRAQDYMRGQVEDSGLVRYHGLASPGAEPGCELPPDSDDTALVWRLAPPGERARLRPALDVIGRFHDGAGLYRTWLADDHAHRCFYSKYSGREWNPADVAIQMHLYLFFVKDDPAAARPLCDALRRRISDRRIWVYYEVAPFLPHLREADLALTGCPLRIPADRLRQARGEQRLYLTLGGMLGDLLVQDRPVPSLGTIRQALQNLAEGGFARLERTPPLLYHNDLSATPPHFHWSAEVGYALWVRVYVEAVRRHGAPWPLAAMATEAR